MSAMLILGKADQSLELDREYLWRRSDGWVINGRPNRWLIYAKPRGYNGAGGYWVDEIWRWESGGTHHVQPRSLSYDDSKAMERAIAELESLMAVDAVDGKAE